MFNYFKKLFKKTEKIKEGNEKEQEPDLDPEEIFKQLQPKIDGLATTCTEIKTEQGKALKLENSKFGGLPFYPAEKEVPKDNNGKPLRFLAQLNFSEIPNLAPFPKKGLLQFFIAEDDDMYGMDFDNPISQKGWSVFFFDNLDFTPRKDFAEIYNQEWEYSPLLVEPLALTFSLKKDYPIYPSIEYYRDIRPLFDQVEKGDYADLLEDIYFEKQPAKGHKIGGSPYYTQNEIRELRDQFLDYQLLFQIDSDDNKIMWGDVGVANFFVKKEDLEKRDFSKVLYNWDCH